MVQLYRSIFCHVNVFCPVLFQNQMAEKANPWGWAAVQDGGRGLRILGQISCKHTHNSSFRFFIHFWLLLWQNFTCEHHFPKIVHITFTCLFYNSISNGRSRIMWSKIKLTTWHSCSTMTKCQRSAILTLWSCDYICAQKYTFVWFNLLYQTNKIKTELWLLDTQFNHNKRRTKTKGDRFSVHTSLIVAAMKRLVPLGLRACSPGDQNLIMLAKNGFSQVGWKCINKSLFSSICP